MMVYSYVKPRTVSHNFGKAPERSTDPSTHTTPYSKNPRRRKNAEILKLNLKGMIYHRSRGKFMRGQTGDGNRNANYLSHPQHTNTYDGDRSATYIKR